MEECVAGQRADGESDEELQQVAVEDAVTHHWDHGDGEQPDQTDDDNGQRRATPHCRITMSNHQW